MTDLMPRGCWVIASLALRRPCRADEPYPHIEGATVTGTRTGAAVRLTRRDCAACAEAAEKSKTESTKEQS